MIRAIVGALFACLLCPAANAAAINKVGAITGYRYDSSNAAHGFLRVPQRI